MLCRSAERGAKALDQIVAETSNKKLHLLVCDPASQADIHRAVHEFGNKFDHLHVLINNAEIYTPERTVTEDGIETQFAVNYLSYFMLMKLLIDKSKASAGDQRDAHGTEQRITVMYPAISRRCASLRYQILR